MAHDAWQFTAPPFAGGIEPATFHLGTPQEEALARLEWLVGERQRLALVVAPEGHGKSHLLATARRRLGGAGCEVALVSLAGLGDEDWLPLLLARLPLEPQARDEPTRPWQKLEDRLRENLLLERTTVILGDDADRAPPTAIEGLARLVTSAEPLYGRTLLVLAATPAGAARLPAALHARAAVRIELAAWEEEDVGAFLAGALERAGGDPALFSPAAVATIARYSGGVPGVVRRLARLVLVVAQAAGAERIDAATVERAWRELVPAEPRATDRAGDRDGASLPDRGAAPDDEASAPSPRVRVVRRLGD